MVTQSSELSKEDAIRRLLCICQENDVEIPPDLKECLLTGGDGIEFHPSNIYHPPRYHDDDVEADNVVPGGSKGGGLGASASNSNNRSILFDSFQSIRAVEEQERISKESDVMKDIRKAHEELGLTSYPSWELRVINGSYTITTNEMPSIPVSNKNKNNNNSNDDDANDADDLLEQGQTAPKNQTMDYSSHQTGKSASSVPNKKGFFRTDMPTVINTGIGFKFMQRLRYFRKTGKVICSGTPKERYILKNLNLHLKSGKIYLILGLPGSGKSTVLKYISNLLRDNDKDHICDGNVILNNVTPDSKEYEWTNLVSYTDQIDRNHEYLTVKETLNYSFQCRRGGKHKSPAIHEQQEHISNDILQQMDQDNFLVTLIMKAFGLTRVENTFVGDDERVRGVSGGERKRVTVAEMSVMGTPVSCMDEISTGLDAATTYDICKTLRESCQFNNSIRVVSLLQPPPETVALFDELILVNRGEIIYAGPLLDAVPHFESLGYELPDRVDAADWLLALPTPEGAKFLIDDYDNNDDDIIVDESNNFKNNKNKEDNGNTTNNDEEDEKEVEIEVNDGTNSLATEKNEELATTRIQRNRHHHLSHDEFVQAYISCDIAKTIQEENDKPFDTDVNTIPKAPELTNRYANHWFRSLWLVMGHEFLLWKRDIFRLKARIIQGIVMGLVVGTVFYKQASNPTAGVGVIYQSLFFMSLGGLTKVIPQVDGRAIFYKHQDANFFPTSAYVIGRSIANIPSSLLDALFYGVPVFFLSGMAYSNGASIANFFVFLLTVLVAAYTTFMAYTILSATCSDKPSAIGVGVAILLFMVVFSGFTVQPDVIPNYWIWLYWLNYFAWLLRSLLINQYLSGAFDQITESGLTLGETYLESFGFVSPRTGNVYGYEWVWYGILFSCGTCIIAGITNIACLNRIRFISGQSLQSTDAATEENKDEDNINEQETKQIDLPFQKANLTFKNIRYTVKSSISKESIELLKGVDGYFAAGKMTALMGSSGAGKTTLMDVLALRKQSGTIEGTVCINGHQQEPKSFRRCTGYVEQFDVQSEQLTVRETIEFSAKMRLDRSTSSSGGGGEALTQDVIDTFVNSTLQMLELTSISDFLVGSDSQGGLSFEQKKRLSIAVEVASNPSILFLDEPTSGLDARAAAIVMRGLKRIAQTGRAVCATIHQPSVAIFNSFDMLLLLKRGGEVVYFGELGNDSINLIQYFERYDCTPPIRPGENPATWMLTTIGSGTNASDASKSMDFAKAYDNSKLHTYAMESINEYETKSNDTNLISYPTTYATTMKYQLIEVFKRQLKVYWRSPSYNRNRLLLAAIIGLLFGSVFASQRVPTNEGEMNSRVTSMYISTLFTGVIGFSTVLPFFERERNMFYRHKASLMYDQLSITLAFLVAETPFILLQSMVFSICFYFPLGFSPEVDKFFWFYFFVTCNVALWVFVGQMFVALLTDSVTAQGFGSILISMSSLFAGILIPPQNISSVWIWAYWVFPLHYVIEGLVVSQYHDDYSTEIAPSSSSSPYAEYLQNTSQCNPCSYDVTYCCGNASNWVDYKFGGLWVYDNLKWNALYLICVILVSKLLKLYGLWKFNYLAK